MSPPYLRKLTVAIVTYGETNSIIEKCLKSIGSELSNQDRAIIIHEGTEDQFRNLVGLVESFQFPFQCLSLDGDGGLSNGRNLAIDKCDTEWIAFIDDDAEMIPGWRKSFQRGVDKFPDSAGFTGPLYPIYEDGSKRLPDEMQWIVSCNSFGSKKDGPVRNGYGANMVFNALKSKKNSIFFDPSFGAVGGTEGDSLAGEETIFSMKLRDLTGNDIIWLHDLKVGHNVPRSRTTLSYVLHRSIKEGKTKAILGKSNIVKNSRKSSLSKELPHLLRTIFLGIPKQLIQTPLRPVSSLWNIVGIFLMILGTGWGYLTSGKGRNLI